MVLQNDRTLPVWGTAEPGEKIIVRCNRCDGGLKTRDDKPPDRPHFASAEQAAVLTAARFAAALRTREQAVV